jgi:hypothetical protein
MNARDERHCEQQQLHEKPRHIPTQAPVWDLATRAFRSLAIFLIWSIVQIPSQTSFFNDLTGC